MFGYIDLRPERLRYVALQFKASSSERDLLLSVADSLEAQDEVLDNLASKEREKLQQEMAAVRAENVSLRKQIAELRNE